TFGNKICILAEHSKFPKVGVVSFTLQDCHPHDIAGILSEHSVCIRAGHHCAMPLHKRLNVQSTSRASMYMYSTEEDITQFMKAVKVAYTLLTGKKV
nr:aminotransferase class V-fold PLP-dependent enzyme [Candidatus Woesebacteria bacterium]